MCPGDRVLQSGRMQALTQLTHNHLVLLVSGSLAFGVGAGFMKPAHGFTRLAPSVVVAACFLLGAVLISRAVMTDSLAASILIGLGLEAVAALLIGVLFFRETLTLQQGLGAAVIVAGVAITRLA